MEMISVEQRRGEAAVLRRIWRLHFWVGLFTAPVLLVLACTGLLILYAQPLALWLDRDLMTVPPGTTRVSLDDQVATAREHVGADLTLDAVTPTPAPGASTRVDFVPSDTSDVSERNLIQVFVDPYTGRYLGQRSELSGPVGWANQLHRMFGNDGPTVSLPSVGHLIAPTSYPDATVAVGVGNLVLELTAVWILVLLASGVYLWWPRAIEGAKPLLSIRMRGGRIFWRDLHATTGILLAVVLICYVVSGLSWSRYWGENWRAVTSTVTPSIGVDAPSTPAKVGDFDRLGRRIAWAATDDPVYASLPGNPVPARIGFADVEAIARSEHMVAGYSIVPPIDETVGGKTVFGSYTVINGWPQKLSEQRTLYLDQFSGQTIANATAASDGRLARLTGWGVNMHMGTQYGLVTRILATVACLGLVTSIGTGAIMWWKRRRPGSAGLPGPVSAAIRADTPRGAVAAVCVVAGALAILYPSFGVTLLVVLAAEVVLALRGRRVARAQTIDDTAAESVPLTGKYA